MQERNYEIARLAGEMFSVVDIEQATRMRDMLIEANNHSEMPIKNYCPGIDDVKAACFGYYIHMFQESKA